MPELQSSSATNQRGGQSDRSAAPAAATGRRPAAHPARGRSYAEGAEALRAPAAPPPPGRPHVVAAGETLWSIAAQTLGDGGLWPKLWAANRSVVPDKDHLTPGMQLTIPDALRRPAPAAQTADAAGGAELTDDQVRSVVAWYRRRPSQYPPGVFRQLEEKVGQPAQGLVDAQTVRAIAAWQRAQGLEVDGIAGPATLQAMFGRDIRMGREPRESQRTPSTAEEPGATTPVEAGLSRPHGLTQIQRVFGKPGTQIVGQAMRAGQGGAMRTVYCHAKIAPVLAGVFDDIHKAGLSEHILSFGGCYVYRKKRSKGTAWSTHAWGISVDINAQWNPMVKKRANMQVSDGQRLLLPFFEARGFYWGGHFGDPMHFQYCTGY